MAIQTPDAGIGWCDRTWNCFRGCSRVNAECDHCYAAAVANRFNKEGQPYEGLGRPGPHGPDWTGTVIRVDRHRLAPLGWSRWSQGFREREGRDGRVFVNSMSDIFHPSVPVEWVDEVAAVIALQGGIIFQSLTKRGARQRDYFNDPETPGRVRAVATRILGERKFRGEVVISWPPPNWHVGVSSGSDETAAVQLPALLATKAAVVWLSAEPLLGPLDLHRVPAQDGYDVGFASALRAHNGDNTHERQRHLDWVVVGGESGAQARKCDVAWVRAIVEQCERAQVPCYVKQLGAKSVYHYELDDYPPLTGITGKGGDPAEWPEDLRVRQFPKGVTA